MDMEDGLRRIFHKESWKVRWNARLALGWNTLLSRSIGMEG